MKMAECVVSVAKQETVAPATRRIFTPEVALRLQKALTKKPQSRSDLADVGDISKRVAQRYVDEMKAKGALHVADWANDARGYPTIRLYKWGKGVDAECPTQNNAERMRNRRAAAKAAKK